MSDGVVMDVDVWPDGTISKAWFDASRRLRYMLERDFRPNLVDRELAGAVTFVMLNPSTADALKNDPTVARCCDFAKRWGFKRLIVVNLYALRSTDPRALLADDDRVGEHNDRYIVRAAEQSDRVIAAWGANVTVKRDRRDIDVLQLLHGAGCDVHALRVTKHRYPSHPLYIPAATVPVMYRRHQS